MNGENLPKAGGEISSIWDTPPAGPANDFCTVHSAWRNR
jgi:hypothetical protein